MFTGIYVDNEMKTPIIFSKVMQELPDHLHDG